ncbi:Exodeoxyribonuclease VII small subunit [Cyclonatronum proteinivorum]|uniref:Exodeoxyribonuclease 7 small subunit n=1 Tax=Cyclonatronum proteinivorum TaxID=1457365 RepID=A0A345UFZ5_9BACT|nr:exodeoxyribonuclease VII small subunit [Cyclonatronum proteinivorum]AXI99396.1 Exodeoxyribonuclease VII small subunit [Cyclonatronum proteinivorum]
MSTKDKDLSFEEALIQLEQVVAQLEKPDQPLKESVKHFEQGLKLSRYCNQILEQAELRVEHVKQNDTSSL